MENKYWVSGQVLGRNYSGAFGQPVTIANGVLMPEHLASGGAFEESVINAYPEHVRATLQVAITGIYKFEDASADDTFRAEVLKAADEAEALIEREGHADYILDDLIAALRALS